MIRSHFNGRIVRLLPLILLACSTPTPAATGILDQIAAHYRQLEGLAPAAKGSAGSLKLLGERGGLAGLEQHAGDGVAAAEIRLLGKGDDRALPSARAAWRALAASGGGRTLADEDRQRALRLYNLACAACAAEVDWGGDEWRAGETVVELEREGFLAGQIANVSPSCLQAAKGFEERVVSGVIGGSVVVSFPQSEARETAWPYLPPLDFPYPAVALLSFDGERPRLALQDPLARDEAELFGGRLPIQADYTAPFAAMVAQRDPEKIGDKGSHTPRLDLEALYVLEPPRDEKTPILFLHGLGSSPAAFRELALALRADPKIRRRFQFVVYQYPTGYPLSLLNARLRKVMPEFWTWFDGRAPKARQNGYIAIGHSMGGLQIKSLSAASGDRIWETFFEVGRSEVELTGIEGQMLERLTTFEPDPSLARIIFMAVPHRGSGWVGGLTRAIARSRLDEDPIVSELREGIIKRYGNQLREEFRERLAKPRLAIDNLDPDAPYLQALTALPFREGLPYHSIIGDRAGKLDDPLTDGVVRYSSAHLEGAASELVVKSDHDVQRCPEAIAEVKRILLLHLAEAPDRR